MPLLVVTGPPGSGKSTVSQLLVERIEPSVLVEGDAFFGFLARGEIPPWLPESHHQNDVVTQAGASAAGRYAMGGYFTVYDGILGPWFLSTFLEATGLLSLDYIVLMPSVERCVAGVRNRVGHGFTDEDATRKMHLEFAAATIDARHVLVDPPEGPDAVADMIATALDRGDLQHPARR
jgi:predicted ABC-type ATPase